MSQISPSLMSAGAYFCVCVRACAWALQLRVGGADGADL